LGLLLPVSVTGDFEITAAIEILDADEPQPPKKSYGVGVLLSVNEQARVGRLLRPDQQNVISWDHWATVDGQRRLLTGAMPGEGNTGRLRLLRQKGRMHMLWSPGLAGDTFLEAHQFDYDAPEIDRIRLELSSNIGGGKNGLVDLRLLELKIRSSTAPILPAADPGDEPTTGAHIWLALAALVGLLVVAALAATLLLRYRRRTAAPADTADAPTPLAFACAGCGKRLKVRAELAGKRTKCPKCGNVMAVPHQDRTARGFH
jgi:hypothetical protein